MKVYEVFPPESGKADELRWSHSGRFWNAAGAIFRVSADDRRSLGQARVEILDGELDDVSYYAHP